MSVSEIIPFDKDGQVERFPLFKRLFLALVIVLVASLSFGLGRLSGMGGREGGVKIEYDPALEGQAVGATSRTSQAAGASHALPLAGGGEVVVSKNGARYHFPHCAGAKQIKEENKVVFPSPAAAEAAGYTLAANCKPR